MPRGATARTLQHPPASRAPSAAFVLVALAVVASVLAVVVLALGLAGCFESPAVKEPELPTGRSRAVAEALLPSVVDVRAWGGDIEEGRVTIGTGVVVEEGGFIVTNDHVLTGNGDGLAAEIEVVVDGGDRLDAVLVGRDPAMDLALLQVERGDLPVAKFYRRDARVGQAVLAIGAPRTLDDGFAAGRVTAVKDDVRVPDRSAISALLETDAPLLPGYSGGPVADRKGRVLGISIGTTMGDERADRAFAIPSADVLRTVRRLMKHAAAA
ncbi:MAG TPA: serine protease [Thermoleophilia bacterium]|nr:serine protease [Thermoleophilia bacterium]